SQSRGGSGSPAGGRHRSRRGAGRDDGTRILSRAHALASVHARSRGWSSASQAPAHGPRHGALYRPCRDAARSGLREVAPPRPPSHRHVVILEKGTAPPITPLAPCFPLAVTGGHTLARKLDTRPPRRRISSRDRPTCHALPSG